MGNSIIAVDDNDKRIGTFVVIPEQPHITLLATIQPDSQCRVRRHRWNGFLHAVQQIGDTIRGIHDFDHRDIDMGTSGFLQAQFHIGHNHAVIAACQRSVRNGRSGRARIPFVSIITTTATHHSDNRSIRARAKRSRAIDDNLHRPTIIINIIQVVDHNACRTSFPVFS